MDRNAIWNFDHVVSTGVKLLKAAKILDLAVYTTEQNPKGKPFRRYSFEKMNESPRILTPQMASPGFCLALGPTVAPLASLIAEHPAELGGGSSAQVHSKTRFSMVLPDSTEKWLKSVKPDGGVKDVIIFGIGA